MKKKVLAFLLASTMVIEPFSVASAADFSDGLGQDTVQFSDDAEDVPEVENDDVDQFGTDAVGEGESSSKPSEDAIQMGDDVWFRFDDLTGTVTISGKGDMWDYYENGYDYSNIHQNPFAGRNGIKKIVVENDITNIGNFFLSNCDRTEIEEILLGKGIKKIGKAAFTYCKKVNSINLPAELEKICDKAFYNCSNIENIELPNSVKILGSGCFSDCNKLKSIKMPDTLKFIGNSAFSNCENLTAIILPKKLEEIGDSAFDGCENLIEITLPSNVKTIGKFAFMRCRNLSIVTFEEGFSCDISYDMFCECICLKEIIIPSNISNIEFGAFYGCSQLLTVKFEGNTTRIDEKVFENCRNLRTIKGYDCSYAKKYYDSLTSSQKQQIKFKSLGEGSHKFTAQKVQIKEPTCIEKGIKAYRCEICGKTNDEEEIPAYDHKWDGGEITKQATETEEGVRTYTCRRCNETKTESIPKLSSIQIEDASYGWLAVNTLHIKGITNKDASYYVTYVPREDDKPEYDQQHEREDTSDNYISAQITVPNYEIDVYIFAVDKNGNVTYAKVTPDYTQRPQKPTIKVGDNVTATVEEDTLILTGTGYTYGNFLWRNLHVSSIKHIIVSNGITSIGNSLFNEFRSVNTIELPASLEFIDDRAFSRCRSLQSVVVPEGVTTIGKSIFDECNNLKSISFPSTLNTIPYLGGIGEDDGLNIENVVINKGIKEIGASAFSRMNNLKTITIPDSVVSIGQYAFRDCTSLFNLSLPDSITEIGGEAFSNCTSLDKIVLPNKLTSLGYSVFEGCNTEIVFPASLKYIPHLGENAVNKVTIPEGVETIGDATFSGCYNLSEITLPSTITSIESGAFYGTSITSFNYPQNLTSISSWVFQNTNLKEFAVPEKVTEINDNAFKECYDLVKITIPKSVTYIGTDAFRDCRNLTIYGYKDSAAESYAKANNIKFVSADYKVIFKDNGRTQKTEYVTKGQNATPPTLSAKEGYILSWDADYTNITEDMVINAVWTKKDSGSNGGGTTIIVSPSETTKYTVTFKDRGKIVKTEKVKSGDAAEYPFITRNGYELSWDKDFSKITADTTVNAVWTVIKPEKVTSLTAEAGKKSIALSWDETEFAGYYLVYRKADSEKEYTQIAKTTKILWTDSKAVPGTQYSYKVVAVRSLEGKKYQGADSDVVTTKIGTPQIGDTYSVGNLNYKITAEKEVSVTGLAKITDTLAIPSSVTISGKVYKVTAIQDKAFYRNEDIVNVTIGNNVVNVGKYAFYQCSGLETVKFGKRVAIINTCAFTQCPNLENVTLPSSIRKIGAKAFYQCTSIKIFKVNGSALEYVGKKGLAINKSVTLKLPKKSYSLYQKLIKASSVYVKTKFVKF